MKSLLLRLGCLWLRSLRVHWVADYEIPRQAVIVLWHEHLPACIRAFSHRGIDVLISKSTDGSWAAGACKRFGYHVHRGSSSRGGSTGLRTLARSLEISKGSAGMALDGPRGPRRKLKPGALWLSNRAGVPIVPVLVRARFAWRLKTWDYCLIPWPFSKIEIHLGPILHSPDAAMLGQAMHALEFPLSRADIYIHTPNPVLLSDG